MRKYFLDTLDEMSEQAFEPVHWRKPTLPTCLRLRELYLDAALRSEPGYES